MPIFFFNLLSRVSVVKSRLRKLEKELHKRKEDMTVLGRLRSVAKGIDAFTKCAIIKQMFLNKAKMESF